MNKGNIWFEFEKENKEWFTEMEAKVRALHEEGRVQAINEDDTNFRFLCDRETFEQDIRGEIVG